MITDKKQFQPPVLQSSKIGHTSVTSEKPSVSPTLSCLDISSLNSLNKTMNTEGCFKKNHPKWSRLDQKAQKNFANVKSSPWRFEKTNDSMVLRKFVNASSILSFGRDTTCCCHLPNFDRERSAKYHHSSNMAEHDSVTHIVTHHTLAKPQRSKPHSNHPSPLETSF